MTAGAGALLGILLREFPCEGMQRLARRVSGPGEPSRRPFGAERLEDYRRWSVILIAKGNLFAFLAG